MPDDTSRATILLAALFAAAAPSLLAYNVAPSPTFLNQALALIGWGGFVLAVGGAWRPLRPLRELLWALALAGVGVVLSWWPGSLPAGLALSGLGMIAAAALLLLSGQAAARGPEPRALFTLFCLAWVAAGVLNSGLAMIQVFLPSLPDGDWIARSSLPGRAVGNLRQPNHLSSLLLWSCIAAAFLMEAGKLRPAVARACLALFVFAVVLTASRTGLVSVLLLALWGAADRRLGRAVRGWLVAAPLLYALAWGGMALWAQAGAHTFGGEARLAESDISSSRFGIWANAWALIRAQPWTGVGFGEFNLAWSLTPFPGRPTAFFDHTHNLPLQLIVELGLPLGGAVLALLLLALWRAARDWREADASRRSALVMVGMIGLHSLLEYPLWYAYFLLPTAWAWGYALGEGGSSGATGRATLARAGALLIAAALAAVWDYQRVVVIYEAPGQAAPLEARITEGRRSLLFAHHADYAAVTTGIAQPDGLAAFDGAVHYLLDTRLMTAWARALDEAGKRDEAAHLVARLREFRNPNSRAWLAACLEPASAAASFQCQPPGPALPWRHFVRQ